MVSSALIRMAQCITPFSLVASALFCVGCNRSAAPPLEPEDALKAFHLPDGFRIELVASEPLITDPVEVAFDARGRMFVAEMEDYPAEGAPGGRIMVLEDRDNNGYFETANVFADSLPYVNGVMPWRNGVLVTSAPDIIYLEDTTGDHHADIRRVVLTGFAFTNPQLRMSSLRYGLDNWIYGAYSRAGGQRGYPEFTNHGEALRFPDDPKKDSADIYPGTDFRFKPDSLLIEPAGGMSQFGNSFDEVGNRFTIWNNVHLRHVVLDARYTTTNPTLKIPSAMASVSDHGDAATVYSRAENRLDLHESEIGHFTSACGHSIYTGGIFDAPYSGAAFVCEPVSNLVHIDLLKQNGVTFVASRLKENDEFLTSTDNWFRPVNTTVGPDGGLYVVDFYRKLVEHPAWIARADDKGIYTHAGVLQEKDFLEGNDRGRIYRIVPVNYRRSALPALQDAQTDTLVAALGHPNMWRRVTAQRLLVDRQDRSAVMTLKNLFSSSLNPLTRIHALRTLQGLRAVDERFVLTALSDKDHSVRKHAVQIAEGFASQAITQQLLTMADEEEPALLFQVALTLSTLSHEQAFPVLRSIALERLGDPWFHSAVLSGAAEHGLKWFISVSDFPSNEADAHAKAELLKQVASMIGVRNNPQEVSHLIDFIAGKDTVDQRYGLEGLVHGRGQTAERIMLTARGQAGLLRMLEIDTQAVQDAGVSVAERMTLRPSGQLINVVQRARMIARDTTASLKNRAYNIRLLGLAPRFVDLGILKGLINIGQPAQVQIAAARVLAKRDDPEALNVLADRWNSSTTEVRAVIEAGFTGSAERLNFFLNAVETRGLDPKLMSGTLRSRLQQSRNAAVRQRAQKILAGLAGESRESVINSYHEATTLSGDVMRGREVFRVMCSSCHVLDGVGRSFGPDLLSVSGQTRINLLAMIIDPNNNIAPGYDGYLIETTEGRTFTGILRSETAAGVVLLTPDGREEVIARSNIRNMRPMSESLMPEGLESNINKQEMADLISYLKETEAVSRSVKASVSQ